MMRQYLYTVFLLFACVVTVMSARAQLTMSNVGSGGFGVGTGGGTCAGVVDFSAGCMLPMIGGL